MDKTQLNRHDLIEISTSERYRIFATLQEFYQGEELIKLQDLFKGDVSIPGIVRRAEQAAAGLVALGFVHPTRGAQKRFRVASFAYYGQIERHLTPYNVLELDFKASNSCLNCLQQLNSLARNYQLALGVLGSAALEIATGLKYTDSVSDIDLLIKASNYEQLLTFYQAAINITKGVKLDVEIELPNGYGIKLAELARDSNTILGKSLTDVQLLSKKEIINFLK